MADIEQLDTLVKGILEMELVTIEAVQRRFDVGFRMAEKVIRALRTEGALESVQGYRATPAFDARMLDIDIATIMQSDIDTMSVEDGLQHLLAEKMANSAEWRVDFVRCLAKAL